MAKKSHLNISRLFILLFMGAIFGLLAGLVTRAFVFAIEEIQHFLWTYLPAQLPALPRSTYTIITCVIGGVLMGLGVKYLGNHPHNIQEDITEFKKTGKFDYKHIPQTFINSLISLGFGAALGPEAALTAIIGGFCTWISEKLHLISAQHDDFATKLHFRLSFMVATLSGFYIYKITDTSSSNYFNFPLMPYSFHTIDLLYAFLIGLCGFAAGLLFLFFGRIVHKFLKRVPGIFGKAILGGLVLGVLGAIWPLVLFSGHEGISQLMTTYALSSSVLLIGIALAKSFTTNTLIATGWKGGQFFPVMFAGSAIGLGIANFANLPPMIGIVAGMTAMLATVLKQPLLAGFLVLFFFPVNLYPAIAISTALIYLLLRYNRMDILEKA